MTAFFATHAAMTFLLFTRSDSVSGSSLAAAVWLLFFLSGLRYVWALFFGFWQNTGLANLFPVCVCLLSSTFVLVMKLWSCLRLCFPTLGTCCVEECARVSSQVSRLPQLRAAASCCHRLPFYEFRGAGMGVEVQYPRSWLFDLQRVKPLLCK